MIDFYHYYDIDLYPANFIEYTSNDHPGMYHRIKLSKKKLSQESRKGFLFLCYFALMKLYYVIFRIFINFANILLLY